MVSTPRPIHPFPARMAPEIALEACEKLTPGCLVLDPMCGSGTALRAASDKGHRAIGFDLDPLAVLISRVYGTPIQTDELRASAQRVIRRAKALDASAVRLSHIDEDFKTRTFIDFWFA